MEKRKLEMEFTSWEECIDYLLKNGYYVTISVYLYDNGNIDYIELKSCKSGKFDLFTFDFVDDNVFGVFASFLILYHMYTSFVDIRVLNSIPF